MRSSLSTPEQDEAVGSQELFLLHLRYKEGRLIDAEGNRPILLDDPDSAWIVYAGAVDLFAIPTAEAESLSLPRHLFRSRAGQIVLGGAPDPAAPVRLLLRGTTGTRLLRIKAARLWDLGGQLEYRDIVAAMCAGWAGELLRQCGDGLPPKDTAPLEAGRPYELAAGQAVRAARGLLWARPGPGDGRYYGSPELAWAAPALPLPIAREGWLSMGGAATLSPFTTAELLEQGAAPACFARLHQLACAALALRQHAEASAERASWREREAAEQAVMQHALRRLAAPLDGAAETPAAPPAGGPHAGLLAACRMVCEAQGIALAEPPRLGAELPAAQALRLIARASHMQMREVELRGRWWRSDSGPLLAFGPGGQPLALLRRGSAYRLWAAEGGAGAAVTAETARTLAPRAYMFYRSFPEQALGIGRLIRFGLRGSRGDLLVILAVGSLLGLLGLVPPVASGLILNQLVPSAAGGLILQVGAALLLVALLAGLFQIARGIALLRVQSRFDAQLQAAVWGRLLSLPVPFFRDYTAGALGLRAMGVSQMSRLLSGHVVNTILNTIFSVFNLGLLFYYSPPLALAAIGLVALALLITTTIAGLYLRYHRGQAEFESQVSSVVLQLLKGVTKIRVAGVENQAFAQWAGPFTAQRELAYRSRKATNVLSAYNAAYPLFALLAIFTLVALSPRLLTSVGDLVAFNLAFAQFLGSWSLFGATLMNVLPVIPIYERLRPILEARPEVDQVKTHPGELSGKIEIAQVSFRYSEKGATVLQDVSLEVQPGEFVALVGASGSGKSTLLRLLLGFDRPTGGAIYFNDQDVADLDLREVRAQVGVVLQNATLLSGEIFSNILGSATNLTIDDAWEAAQLAGIDEDIRAMPMGMHTLVSEGGGNLSGGQRQRLLIARALVSRPRILFFDEATSALDNRTQEVVSRSIEALQATRIVIAHRLSTIVRADRIVVFDQGRIAQVGTYDALLNQPGPFAELARRQRL